MSGVLGEDNGPLLFTGQTNRNDMLRPEPCPVRKVLTSRPMSGEVTVIEGRSLRDAWRLWEAEADIKRMSRAQRVQVTPQNGPSSLGPAQTFLLSQDHGVNCLLPGHLLLDVP